MKEIGGYLPLELADGKEFFNKINSRNIIRLNGARYAIVSAIEMGSFKKIWLPVYLCQSVYSILEKAEIPYSTYNINMNFEPDIKLEDEEECILIVNYFGQKSAGFYSEMILKYRNIIFDNTQSFFIDPILNGRVYNVYSPRKFVGVPDGGYLIAQSIEKIKKMEQDKSSRRAVHLLGSIEEGTNAFYGEYLAGEDEISISGMKGMSFLTRKLLGNINYGLVKERRSSNYKYLYDRLGYSNEMKLCDDPVSPMIYPLFIKNEGLRKYLIDHKVYVPQWWKWVIDNPNANDRERDLSKYLLPIPIDQRYTHSDMDYICNLIESYL